MASLRGLLKGNPRRLILGGCAVVLFALWFGLWLRVLQPHPRASWRFPEPLILYRISPDGQYLLAWEWSYGGSRRALHVFNLESGRRLQILLQGVHHIEYAVTSPDGKRLVCCACEQPDGLLFAQVFDLETGRSLLRQDDVPEFEAEFSPGGKYLVIPTRADAAERRESVIYDAGSLQPVLRLRDNDARYWGVSVWFSPDSKDLVYCVREGERSEVRFREVESGRTRWKLAEVGGLAVFSPDGKLLAVSSEGRYGTTAPIRIVDARTGTVLKTLIGHREYVTYCVFSTDGELLTAIGASSNFLDDDEVTVWRLADGQVLCRYDLKPGSRHDGKNKIFHYGEAVGYARELFSFEYEGSELTIDVETGRVSALDERSTVTASWPRRSQDARYRVSTIEVNPQDTWLQRLVSGRNHDSWATIGLHVEDLETGESVRITRSASYLFLPGSRGLLVHDGEVIEIWDMPAGRPVFLLLALAAAPTLLFTGALWWRWGRLA